MKNKLIITGICICLVMAVGTVAFILGKDKIVKPDKEVAAEVETELDIAEETGYQKETEAEEESTEEESTEEESTKEESTEEESIEEESTVEESTEEACLVELEIPGATKENSSSQIIFVSELEDITLALNREFSIEMPPTIENVSYVSSQPEIVAVDTDGNLMALAVGNARITVEVENGEFSTAFDVVVTTPEISHTSITKIVGYTEQISIMGTNGTPTFKSENTAIATVSDTGLVTAQFTGAGQSTKIIASVDGQDFVVDVKVEPVPQLLSTYKIFGYDESGTYTDSLGYEVEYTNARIEMATNANEVWYVDADMAWNSYAEEVISLGSVDYSAGNVYPLYRMYSGGKENHTQIMLVGSSQEASVIAKKVGEGDCNLNVSYIPCDGYGIIDVWGSAGLYGTIVTVLIGEDTYQFAVTSSSFGFSDRIEEETPDKYIIKNLSVEGEEVIVNRSAASLQSTSSTYYGSSSSLERIGSKLVEAVENEAISFVVKTAFKILF